MSQQSARVTAPQEITVTILSGPESGVAYKLVGDMISLGRDAQNDVILQDEKSSRQHAVIERRRDGFWIKDLGSKSGVVINGKKYNEYLLQNGDQILLGETKMRFGMAAPLTVVNSPPPLVQGPAMTGPSMPGPAAPGISWMPPLPKSPRFKPGSKASPLLYVVTAAVVIVIALAMNKSSDTRKFLKIKDPKVDDSQLENINENNEKREAEILKKGKDTQAYYDAQAFYLRGFREYREGNYQRAIQNFQAALALYPSHQLARTYLDRSKVKNDELVTSALERAEKAFELQRYNKAYSEYRTVLLLSGDPKSEKFRLAKKRMEAIELIFANSK